MPKPFGNNHPKSVKISDLSGIFAFLLEKADILCYNERETPLHWGAFNHKEEDEYETTASAHAGALYRSHACTGNGLRQSDRMQRPDHGYADRFGNTIHCTGERSGNKYGRNDCPRRNRTHDHGTYQPRGNCQCRIGYTNRRGCDAQPQQRQYLQSSPAPVHR